MNTTLSVSTRLAAADARRRTSPTTKASVNSRSRLSWLSRAVPTLLALHLSLTLPALADATAFTWQGRLSDSGQPATGLYDLRFTLHDAPTGGTALGTNTLPAAAVSNGLYTATLDFGTNAFDGSARWLEFAVRTNGAPDFTTLAPRQLVTPTPYAIRAANFSGAVTEAQLPANVATGAAAANGAASANVPGTLVKRDASGDFAASTIAANLAGNAATATTAGSFTGALAGEVTGTQSATAVASVGGQSATNVASGASAANAATAANTANALVKRDAAGNFAAGTITGNLAGNATTTTTANNFSGALAGDVAGTEGATVVGAVGGQSAANVAGGASAANAATAANTASAIVKRDATGSFAAGNIAAGSLSGDGANVANLNAANVAAGTLADARLSGNVPLLNGDQSFTGANTFGSAGNSFTGNFTGGGSGLTNLNGANIVSGTVGNAQLAANAVQMGNIASGAVGSMQLAVGAAVANLNASGQSGVASG